LELNKIVAELKTERGRLDRAIAALEGAAAGRAMPAMKKSVAAAPARGPKKRGGLTAAGRKRLSEAMKKRWAERKKKAAKA
jgi:hypothetical protein